MRYSLNSNDETDYINLTVSNEYRILAYDSYTKMLRLLREDKPTRIIKVSDEKIKQLIRKTARKILCTVQ